jgi:hypothetical protein
MSSYRYKSDTKEYTKENSQLFWNGFEDYYKISLTNSPVFSACKFDGSKYIYKKLLFMLGKNSIKEGSYDSENRSFVITSHGLSEIKENTWFVLTKENMFEILNDEEFNSKYYKRDDDHE